MRNGHPHPYGYKTIEKCVVNDILIYHKIHFKIYLTLCTELNVGMRHFANGHRNHKITFEIYE